MRNQMSDMLQLVDVSPTAQANRSRSTHVRYASACRCDTETLKLTETAQRMSDTLQLVVDVPYIQRGGTRPQISLTLAVECSEP